MSKVTVTGRLAFPNLIESRENQNGRVQYDTTLLLDAGEDAKIRAVVEEALIEKFGKKALPQLGKLYHDPLRDQGEKEHLNGYNEGEFFIFAWTKTRPGLVDVELQPVIDPDEVYPGRHARISVRPFAYDDKTKGVGLALGNVQLLQHGDRLDGRISAEHEFAEFRGKAEEFPTA